MLHSVFKQFGVPSGSGVIVGGKIKEDFGPCFSVSGVRMKGKISDDTTPIGRSISKLLESLLTPDSAICPHHYRQ
jgi:hypothetical protein